MTNQEVLEFMEDDADVYFYNGKTGNVESFRVEHMFSSNPISISLKGSSSFVVYSSDVHKTEREATISFYQKRIKEKRGKIIALEAEIKEEEKYLESFK